jgi:hypothetical protein
MSQSKLIEGQLKVYRDNYIRFGDTPEGTFHNSRTTQYLRFSRLIDPLLSFAPEYFSLHDVGAGPADLHKYLLERNIAHRYSGSEIVPEMVQTASHKFSDIQIYCRAIEEAPANEKYDFVVLCGTFNMPGETLPDEWACFVTDTIRKMYSMCRLGISFNFLTSYNTFSVPDLFYIDPFRTTQFCLKELSRFTSLDHAYPLYEATITVLTKECMKEAYREEHFAKYFKN